jgi:hypothetical protein
MLADFQQALADLTASPDMCISVRRNPRELRERYDLTDREWRRLTAIVGHPGMACACIVYRANRLAPLAMNIPATCKALGSHLRGVVDEFWRAYPESNVHFYIETERFCCFLEELLRAGRAFDPQVELVLALESSVVRAALSASHTEAHLACQEAS